MHIAAVAALGWLLPAFVAVGLTPSNIVETVTRLSYENFHTNLFVHTNQNRGFVISGPQYIPGKSNCSFEKLDLVSSHGDDVIAVNRDCRTILISQEPFCLAGRLRDLAEAGAVSLRADFINRPYTPSEVAELWRALRSGKNPPRGHIGNFDRGLK
jgi:hypothetical protein